MLPGWNAAKLSFKLIQADEFEANSPTEEELIIEDRASGF